MNLMPTSFRREGWGPEQSLDFAQPPISIHRSASEPLLQRFPLVRGQVPIEREVAETVGDLGVYGRQLVIRLFDSG